ncbi:hypothetical protein Tco_0555753 [Tanacetum coccineum]
MNAKVDEPRISDVPMVRDFTDVFLEDLSMTTTETMGDALSRKERVKSRRVRGMILAAQSEAFKQENILAERLHGLDQQMERKGDKNATESIRDAIGFEYCLASPSGWTKSPVLWAEIGEGSLIGPDLVIKTIDKVVLIKGKLKAARDRQKSYADNRRKLEPRYVGPFEILKRIGHVAYRLMLPKELSEVHDTFHVSNLKEYWTDANMHMPLERIKVRAEFRVVFKSEYLHDGNRLASAAICKNGGVTLADANLHVPLDEIKVDKTLHFVEEPVEIMDREIRNLKRMKVVLVKVRWNLKCGPEFTWEHEDQITIKYPHLFVDRVVEPAS